MKTRVLPLLLPLLLSPLAATPETAAAQSIQRCQGADGITIFTDRSCAAFNATPAGEFAYDGGLATAGGELRDPPATMGRNGATGGFAIRGCARTQGELITGVRGAIEAGDVNRLSNYYHWTGVSSSASVGLMDRLDRIARQTLSGVQFDYPVEPAFEYATASITPEPDYQAMPVADVVYSAGPSYLDRYRPENDDDAPIVSTGIVDASTPLTEARAMTLANSGMGGDYGVVENRANPRPVALRVNNGGGGGTRFSLRRNAGCWFIQF